MYSDFKDQKDLGFCWRMPNKNRPYITNECSCYKGDFLAVPP